MMRPAEIFHRANAVFGAAFDTASATPPSQRRDAAGSRATSLRGNEPVRGNGLDVLHGSGRKRAITGPACSPADRPAWCSGTAFRYDSVRGGRVGLLRLPLPTIINPPDLCFREKINLFQSPLWKCCRGGGRELGATSSRPRDITREGKKQTNKNTLKRQDCYRRSIVSVVGTPSQWPVTQFLAVLCCPLSSLQVFLRVYTKRKKRFFFFCCCRVGTKNSQELVVLLFPALEGGRPIRTDVSSCMHAPATRQLRCSAASTRVSRLSWRYCLFVANSPNTPPRLIQPRSVSSDFHRDKSGAGGANAARAVPPRRATPRETEPQRQQEVPTTVRQGEAPVVVWPGLYF